MDLGNLNYDCIELHGCTEAGNCQDFMKIVYLVMNYVDFSRNLPFVFS